MKEFEVGRATHYEISAHMYVDEVRRKMSEVGILSE